MLSLVGQYKNRILGLNDFMLRARELLGERLYAQLSRDMNSAAAARVTSNNLTPMSMMPLPPNGVSTMPSMMRNVSSGPMPIHSMPQIYGSSSQTFQIPIPLQNSNPIEVDVTKMDTSSLQDVMQYSGVDLKAEAELLYREHDMSNMVGGGFVDHRLKFDYFFNPFKFRAIVQHALQRHFFSNTLNTTSTSSTNYNLENQTKLNKPLGITEEAVHLLGIAIQKRLIGILRRLTEISKHRVDYGRGRFKIKIENDPKKQLWLQEKLFIEGVGEDKRKSSSSSTSHNQTVLNPPTLVKVPTSTSGNVGVSVAATGVSTGQSKASNSSTSSNPSGPDETVKTKLANVTALAALGIRQKSWMSSASTMNTSSTGTSNSNLPTSSSNTSSTNTSTPSSNIPSSNSQTNNQNNDEKDPSESYQHPLSNFYSLPSSTPLTDSELRAQYFNRTISTIDLITCMESDSHLRKSRLLAVLYESLPRENKENAMTND